MHEDEKIQTAIQRMNNLLVNLPTKLEEMVTHPNSPIIKLFDDISTFKILGSARLKTSPVEKCAHDIKVRNSRENLQKLKRQVKELQDTLQQERSIFAEYSKEKIAETNTERNSIIIDAETTKRYEALENENPKNESTRTTEKNSLVKEIRILENEIAKMRESHKIREEELRSLRLSAEKKFLELVQCYDDEISSSHGILLRSTSTLNKMREEQRELEHRMIDHRILYDELKEERERALTKAHIERLENFRRNRAAGIIQRTWRIYYERLSLKRKKKQRKKRT